MALKALLAAASLAIAGPAAAEVADGLTPAEAQAIARDAYYYAFPIVLMDITMRQSTNVPDATSVLMRAPLGQFAHVRSFPPADARDVVRINFDTLYSFAWIDLSAGPVVLSVPDSHGRYYLMPMLDMWTDVFAVPGSRTTRGEARDFALVPPGWEGRLPAALTPIRAPTPTVWILGRVQTNGPADYAAVHAVQDAMTLTPLADWGSTAAAPAPHPVDPAIDATTEPVRQALAIDGVAMLERLAELLKTNPPHGNDYPILFELAQLGLRPGAELDAGSLPPEIAAAIEAGAKAAQADMIASVQSIGIPVNGWSVLLDNVGTYGTSYRQRAIVALAGLGANLPADAIYPTAFTDGDGQPLDGARSYVLHFAKGGLPPADAFWSLTMYDSQSFQVPNPLDRFALGDRDQLTTNPDGSLDIYFGGASPGPGKQANWLPAPANGPFNVTMRLYSPRQEALSGAWAPPPIRATD